jgi:hypothetical protein
MTQNETVEHVRWITWGSVRGQGPIRSTCMDAERDLTEDREGCAAQGGYSDREVYGIDADGYVVDDDGGNVWPYGRTNPALRINAGELS